MGKQRTLNAAELAVLQRIEHVLDSKGMSWAALAVQAGRSKQLGAQWSGRRSFPPQRVLQAIAGVLEVAPSWLLSGDEPDSEVRAATVDEAELLRIMRAMSVTQQRALLASARGLASMMDKKKP